jgi:hypothetical protein
MRYTRQCYFIYDHKKSVPFPVYVVTKLKHARQHEVQTRCFELQCHRTIIVDGPGQPLGLQAVKASRIYTEPTHEGGKVVSRTHRPPLPPRKYSWYPFLLEADSTPGHSVAGWIMPMKNTNDTIGNRTRDLPTCSAMPQPTAPPRCSGYWGLFSRFEKVRT